MSTQNIPLHDFSKDDRSSVPFKLEALEYKNTYDPSVPHRHNYYEIFYFNSGAGYHMIDFDDIPIIPKSLHFVSPGQVHHLRRSLQSDGWVVMFSRDFFYSNLENKDILLELPFFNNKAQRPIISCDQELVNDIERIFSGMQAEYDAMDRTNADIIRSYLNILLLKCKRAYEQRQEAETHIDSMAQQLNTRFKALIEKNFITLHQVGDYSALLSVTPKYLNEIAKKTTGKNASEHIHDRIILEAKRLLLHSSLSSKEIAAFLNYPDPSYFSRFFKKHAGMSPNDFRQSIRQNYK